MNYLIYIFSIKKSNSRKRNIFLYAENQTLPFFYNMTVFDWSMRQRVIMASILESLFPAMKILAAIAR